MRYCNHCHKLYDETQGKCPCRKNVKRQYKHENFYDSQAWRKLSSYIKIRDFNLDRLSLYLVRSDTPQDKTEDAGVYKLLHDFLVDVYGNVRRLSGRLIVHHIVPRDEDYRKQYDVDNLITVDNNTHEFLHQLYAIGKEDKVQTILFHAVKADLP